MTFDLNYYNYNKLIILNCSKKLSRIKLEENYSLNYLVIIDNTNDIVEIIFKVYIFFNYIYHIMYL